MGKKSTKENKTKYHLAREELGWSREYASEQLGMITPERLERIENEKVTPDPKEILAMAETYGRPSLCNYYCSQKCPIGQQYVPEIEVKELSSIVLEMKTISSAIFYMSEWQAIFQCQEYSFSEVRPYQDKQKNMIGLVPC